THSPTASAPNIHGTRDDPRKPSLVFPSGRAPERAAALTAAGAVMDRKPATTPITNAFATTAMIPPTYASNVRARTAPPSNLRLPPKRRASPTPTAHRPPRTRPAGSSPTGTAAPCDPSKPDTRPHRDPSGRNLSDRAQSLLAASP